MPSVGRYTECGPMAAGRGACVGLSASALRRSPCRKSNFDILGHRSEVPALFSLKVPDLPASCSTVCPFFGYGSYDGGVMGGLAPARSAPFVTGKLSDDCPNLVR